MTQQPGRSLADLVAILRSIDGTPRNDRQARRPSRRLFTSPYCDLAIVLLHRGQLLGSLLSRIGTIVSKESQRCQRRRLRRHMSTGQIAQRGQSLKLVKRLLDPIHVKLATTAASNRAV